MKSKRQTISVALGLVFGIMAFCTSVEASQEKTPWDLRCEMQHDPIAVDNAQPRLSWKLPEGTKAQTAYQIVAASSKSDLKDQKNLLWDTGRVPSDQSHLVPYAGKPLNSSQQVFWRVRAWNEKGNALAWSPIATFRAGIMKPADLTAKWIGVNPTVVNNEATDAWTRFTITKMKRDSDTFRTYRKNLLEKIAGNNVLKKEFTLQSVPEKAFLYTSALGYFTVYINGQRVGDELFEPGPGYNRTPKVFYSAHDVTRLLRPGRNTLRVTLTRGRLALWQVNYWEAVTNRHTPGLWLQMNAVDNQGIGDVLVQSDSTWKTAPGAIVKGHFYFGEVYDSRRDTLRRDLPDGDPSWQAVKLLDNAPGLRARFYPPERVIHRVTPVDVFSPATGVWVFDLGEMISGTVAWKVPKDLSPGDKVVFRYLQNIEKDGVPSRGVSLYYPEGTKVTDPERMLTRTPCMGVNLVPTAFLQKNPDHPKVDPYGGLPTDLYVAGGDSPVWEGTERSHAFRYIEVIGLKSKPSKTDLEGLFSHNDLEQIGKFQSANKNFNRFYELTNRTDLINTHAEFSDCWDREKWMWNGDGNVPTSEEMAYSYQIAPLLDRITYDNANITRAVGLPSTNSQLGFLGQQTPLWERSLVELPWTAYKFYGDTKPGIEAQDAMVTFLRYYYNDPAVGTTVPKHLWKEGSWYKGYYNNPAPGSMIRQDYYGDHLWAGYQEIDRTLTKELRKKRVLGTACLYRSADLAKKFSKLAGDAKNVAWFEELKEKISRELIDTYYDAEKQTFGNDPDNKGYGTDVEDSFLINSGIPDAALEETLARSIAKQINDRGCRMINGTHTFVMTMDIMSKYGYGDLVYRALNCKGPGGIQNALTLSPDSLCERIHTEDLKHRGSANHCTLGQICRFFFYGLGGIRPDVDHPGFKQFTLAPCVPDELPWVNTWHISPYGKIVSNWKQANDSIVWNVTVPPNSTATAQIPLAAEAKQITLDGKPIPNAPLHLEPGDYEIVVQKK